MVGSDAVAEAVVEHLREEFGEDLKCVVLYGSRARGTATEESDWDFFVVVEGLPDSRTERYELFRDLKSRMYREYGEFVHFVPASPDGLYEGNPSQIVYGVLTGYEVLYGEGFWADYLDHIRPVVEAEDPVLHQGGESWRIASMV